MPASGIFLSSKWTVLAGLGATACLGVLHHSGFGAGGAVLHAPMLAVAVLGAGTILHAARQNAAPREPIACRLLKR